MARIVKEEEYKAKRNAILDSAQQFITTRGYEQMAIQDILDALQISKGAFYHYFDSKGALLEALSERIGEQIEEKIISIAQDQTLGALEKLLRYFSEVDTLKLAQQSLMAEFIHIWYDDENAIVQRKLYRTGIKRFVPWIAQIIRQGIDEGVFTATYPEQAARVIVALRYDFGTAIAEHFLSEERKPEEYKPSDIALIVEMAEALMEALERILGVKPGRIATVGREALSQWQESLS